MVTIGHHGLTNLLLIDIDGLAQFRHTRVALVLLFELVDLVVDLIE